MEEDRSKSEIDKDLSVASSQSGDYSCDFNESDEDSLMDINTDCELRLRSSMNKLSWRTNPSESFSDWKLEISCGENEDIQVNTYHVHKATLAHSSRYFKHACYNKHFAANEDQVSRFHLPSLAADAVSLFLDYLYENLFTSFTKEETVGLYYLADFFDIPSLRWRIKDVFVSKIDEYSAEEYYQTAISFSPPIDVFVDKVEQVLARKIIELEFEPTCFRSNGIRSLNLEPLKHHTFMSTLTTESFVRIITAESLATVLHQKTGEEDHCSLLEPKDGTNNVTRSKQEKKLDSLGPRECVSKHLSQLIRAYVQTHGLDEEELEIITRKEYVPVFDISVLEDFAGYAKTLESVSKERATCIEERCLEVIEKNSEDMNFDVMSAGNIIDILQEFNCAREKVIPLLAKILSHTRNELRQTKFVLNKFQPVNRFEYKTTFMKQLSKKLLPRYQVPPSHRKYIPEFYTKGGYPLFEYRHDWDE